MTWFKAELHRIRDRLSEMNDALRRAKRIFSVSAMNNVLSDPKIAAEPLAFCAYR